MARWLRWIWKEWRDHRPVLLGVFLAIPVLTGLAFWAFSEFFRAGHRHQVQTIFVGVAMALFHLSVAADLFSGESRRGTMTLVRRLPGGFGCAFFAKLMFLVVSALLLIAWQGACLGLAWDGVGQSDHVTATFAELADFPGSPFWVVGLGFMAVGAWVVPVSTWLGRSGAAALGSLVLLAGIGAPFYLFVRAHPYYLEPSIETAVSVVGISGGVAVLIAAVSWFLGARFASRPWQPAAWGLSLVLLIGGGAYAYAAYDVARWLDVQPDDGGFRISDAYVAGDGRTIYMNVHRDLLWARGRNGEWRDTRRSHGTHEHERGTPSKAWIVDLESGTWREIGEPGRQFFMTPSRDVHHDAGGFAVLEPWPLVTALTVQDKKPISIAWYDGQDGRHLGTYPMRVRSKAIEERVRAMLRARTPVRDGLGRPAWVRQGKVETNERPIAIGERLTVAPARKASFFPAPGGWRGFRLSKDGWGDRFFLDADTGREIDVPKAGQGVWTHVLDPRRMLRVHGESGSWRAAVRWEVTDLDGSNLRALKDGPSWIIAAVARGKVLAYDWVDGAHRLELWNPAMNERAPVAWLGKGPENFGSADLAGQTGDGRFLVALREPGSVAYAVLDPAKGEARFVTGWRDEYQVHRHEYLLPLHIEDAGSLVVLENKRRIVRYGPEPGTREVLFPKP